MPLDPTAALTAQFPHISYRPLADTGAWVSAAGFGGYRVEADNPDHLAALRHALRGGINLIDTSANYSDGGSETAVGQIVAEGILPREQLIIVSKAGYLQGQNYALSQQMQAEGRPFPDLVHYSTGLEHCLHPDFLADQLTRSLGRLGLARLDVFLLHNPEYYLSHAKQMGIEAAEAPRRIRAAAGLGLCPFGARSGPRPHPLVRREFQHPAQPRRQLRTHLAGAAGGIGAVSGRGTEPV
ncbi:MAG: aldo/keto reductase [Chloroflexi bacterium]|nr:aldo/keto reductase [Chloroflexota bacterium]